MGYVIYYYDYKRQDFFYLHFLNWVVFWRAFEYMRFSNRYLVYSTHYYYLDASSDDCNGGFYGQCLYI